MLNELENELSKTGAEQIRSNIERIVASYRHILDIYTELLQNSTDAIIENFGIEHLADGLVSLNVSPAARRLVIADNGIGIPERDLSRILAIGTSLKRERSVGRYGFMGFGLTFVAFQTESLKIESTHNGLRASRTYQDLYRVAYSNAAIPISEEEEQAIAPQGVSEPNGTVITAVFPAVFPDSTIGQSQDRAFECAEKPSLFAAALRQRSAVGSLIPIFTDRQNLKFELVVDDQTIDVTSRFLTTRDVVSGLFPTERRVFTIANFEQLVTATETLPDAQKTAARKCVLIDDKIENVTIGTYNPLTANIYIALTSKDHLNLYNQKSLDVDLNDPSSFSVQNGLWLALGGMPTGICLDTYERAALLPFTVVVDVQDQSLRQELDAGRKGISQYRAAQICERVREILRERKFIAYRQYVVGADSRIGDPLYDPKRELQLKLQSRNEMSIDLTQRFFPPSEEQEVITLFTELLARGFIKGYSQKVLSGYQVYDGLYDYSLSHGEGTVLSPSNPLGVSQGMFADHGDHLSSEVVIEFKTNFEALYRDIDKNKKDISQIDLLVCWSTGPNDAEFYQTERGDLLHAKSDATNVFYGVTHELVTGGRQQPLPIVELSSVLSTLVIGEQNGPTSGG